MTAQPAYKAGMERDFLKMHGLGNDFVIVDGRTDGFTPNVALCRDLGDRRRGIGFDQLIVLEQPKNPDAHLFMRIFNPDGSEAGACGNAARCVANLYLTEMDRTQGILETVSGLLPIERRAEGILAVDFGAPRLDWQAIPLAHALDTLHPGIDMQGLGEPCFVSMGNPHAVFFVPDVQAVNLQQLGPKLEHDPLFPQRANIEIAQIIERSHIRMRVWERGAGITQACGSGACAVLVAAVRRGLADRQAQIKLDGGALTIDWRDENHLWLIGGATISFRGRFDDAVAA